MQLAVVHEDARDVEGVHELVAGAQEVRGNEGGIVCRDRVAAGGYGPRHRRPDRNGQLPWLEEEVPHVHGNRLWSVGRGGNGRGRSRPDLGRRQVRYGIRSHPEDDDGPPERDGRAHPGLVVGETKP